MTRDERDREGTGTGSISRRTLITAMATTVGGLTLAPRLAAAQAPAAGPAAPPSTVTSPPRDFGPNAPPNVYFTDPDVLTIDPAFNALRQANAPIQRLWTGALWSEGPAWNAQGRYLVWSDIPNNRQLRWLEDDGRVSVFRMPSKRIRVNAINPSMVETEGVRTAGLNESDFRRQIEATTPLGRIGQPQDIAPAAVFLASREAGWITGETLVIAGGLR
jgi:hypothetical protein